MTAPDRLSSFFFRNTASRLFGCFVLLHLALWTLLPWLTSFNVPLDVIEGYAWGREWLIGTYKHPPMQSWWLEILAVLTGRAEWAHFLASQIAVAVAFWAVWRTGRRLSGDTKALLGVLLLEGVAYYNFTSPEFNPNVLQLPFWALAGWSFHRAVKENRWFDWALLGVWMAAGIYAKYIMLLFAGILFALLVFTAEGRKRWRSFGPYLALAACFLLLAPHLHWLITHDFLPFTYAQSRTSEATAWYQRLTFPLAFTGAVALALAPMIFLVFVLSGKRPTLVPKSLRPLPAFDRHFLHAVALGPFIVLLLLSALIGFRPRDMWGACLWNFIGLWSVTFIVNPLSLERLRFFAYAWGGVFLLGLAAIVVSNIFGIYATHAPLRVQFPGRALTESIVSEWQKDEPGTFPSYIIGDTWLAGNVAFYAPAASAHTRPRVFIMADPVISPWIDAKGLERNGGILLWCSNRCADAESAKSIPPYYLERFPDAQIQQPLTLSWQTQAVLPPVVAGWAILPPRRD